MASFRGGANMFDWPMADRSNLETFFTNYNYILEIAWHLLSLWSMTKKRVIYYYNQMDSATITLKLQSKTGNLWLLP